MSVTTAPKPCSGSETNWTLASLASTPDSKRRPRIDALTPDQLHELSQTRFDLLDHQLWSPLDWRTWVLMGGRGSGKTFAGANWISWLAQTENLRFALVGATLHDVREVMVEGPSGLKAVSGPKHRPRWEGGRKRLVWPESGSVAYAFSAEDPDSLRGPQFHHAWADEFCAWRKPEAVLDTLRMGLRLGDDPRLVVTTTPRPMPALRRLLAQEGVMMDRAPTAANAANLSPRFLAHLKTLYAGTRLEAQEIEGLIVESEGALFRAEDLARARGARPAKLDRIVVAVDPPVTAGGDACGIVVVGRKDRVAYVLADRSVRGHSPQGWAGKVVAAVQEFGADAVVAESNQGGEMVRGVLAHADCPVPIKLVHASRGKVARAEPVAALYEQGRVVHCGAFPALEEELMALRSTEHRHSPDRADALVWGVTQLMPAPKAGPSVRWL
ncbi:MAG: DNA-packaging protein [Brevundimonas sp.]|uniref:DNA-packaging protein n=1 Tax=Brevundimonas sp. TaxID=1871086 RepID=UPI001A33841E|nr:terminase family protein [Brevundimonas sp.]MBJ7448072.1 DNA-packaging protein [Brevundimonas sp.]